MQILDPKPPIQLYEWERPSDLIHIDVKTLARLRKVGQRIDSPAIASRAAVLAWK